MTTTDEHIGVMRDMFQAIATGDVETLNDLQAPGFTLTVAGTSAVSGQFAGDAAGEQFQRSMELTQGQMSIEPQQLLANEQIGVAVVVVTASRPDGRHIEQRLIHEIRFDHGKIAAIDEWVWDHAADEAFWA